MNLFHRLSDWSARAFGTEWFFIIHFVWWGAWIVFEPEPFPFGLLTLIVSLESIMLSGLILNSTNRTGDADRRMLEKDLHLDTKTQALVEQIWSKLNDKAEPQ